jgi:predicted AAA+ superfamily ATPase
MSNIVEALGTVNAWWDTGKIEGAFVEEALRTEFAQIQEALEFRRVLAIVGPRRVGKSTLIYQTINHLLQEGIEPARILFFTGDNPALTGETITGIVEAYVDAKLHRSITQMEGRVYIFIDEIHFITGWQLHIKTLYDFNPNLKFVISGSSEVQMFLGSRDSLLGRITDVHVLPFCFDQFLRFYGIFRRQTPDNAAPRITLPGKDGPASGGTLGKDFDYGRYAAMLPAQSLFDNPVEYCRALEAKKTDLSFFDLALNQGVREFFLNGGYPEYFHTTSTRYWQRMLTEDIISKGLYRDIVSFYRVTNPILLERLLYIIASNSGGEYAYAGMGTILGIDTTTAATYIRYLSQASLITVLENYSPNAVKVIRKNKRIYLSDSGIRNAILFKDSFNDREEGHLAENACVQMARAYCEPKSFRLYYWRDKKVEVDLVMDKKTHLLPVEIKFRNEIRDEDTAGLRAFMAKYQVKTGLVITRKTLGIDGNIVYVPFRLARVMAW